MLHSPPREVRGGLLDNPKGKGRNAPLLLADARVHGDAGKVAFSEQLVKFSGAQRAFDEDDDLVELERVKELIQLPVFLRLAQLDVVLLQAVQRELRVVIDSDGEWILHEFFANGQYLPRKRGAEHHHLLLRGRSTEYLLHVAPHV